MSVFDRLAPLIPRVSSSSRQAKKDSPGCLSSPPPPHLSLSSPVVKKRAIQIPSFDEKGLVYESSKQSSDRSFVPISASVRTSSQSSGSKCCQYSQRHHEERAATLPRTKPRAYCSASLCTKPSICIYPPCPNSSPTLSRLKAKASDSLHLPISQTSDSSPALQKPSVSPTLTVPTPRLTPSPTALGQGTPLGSQDSKQPSPVAKERRARSIPISNKKYEPEPSKQRSSYETRGDVLDQEALLDFTHPELRRACPRDVTMSRKAGNQPQAYRCQDNTGLRNIYADKYITANTKPNTNTKQQQRIESLSGGTFATRSSLSESEGIKPANAAQASPRLQRIHTNYTQNRYYTHTAGYAYESVPKTPRSTEPLRSHSGLSPTVESRRRRFDSSYDTRSDSAFRMTPREEDATLPPTRQPSSKPFQQPSASANIKPPHTHRFWSKPQCHSDCISKDYSCQSKDSDRKLEAPLCVHGLNRAKTCLVAPRTPDASRQKPSQPASPSGSHKGGGPRDTGPSPTDVSAAPNRRVTWVEKCVSWQPSMERCPVDATDLGSGSKGLFDPKSKPHNSQRPEEETGAVTPNKLNHSLAERAFIAEDPEDPYYVTMYYPGSVYVSMDMSDVIPPEVRPKPAVPAKPPHVGTPSPSSPFPPQGPGAAGGGGGNSGGVSAPPPSCIPVPIGSHGSTHTGGHTAGLGAGLAGVHAVTHPGGQGHGVSNSSSGGSTLLGYIGIDTIIEQMRKKTMKTGFDFNIMVVGHSGLGKSTLLNTLFKSQVSRRSAGWARDEKIPKTVEIRSVSHVIEEGGVKMKLTVVDTPGFGDLINNDKCWEPICKYINEQYEKFLKEEVNITRKKRIPDTRVHCCLYFVSPTGHSLRQLDVEFMKRLSHSVNIIPIIAKADTMTIEERQEFKQRVRKELEMSGIEFYPQKEFDEDMEDKSDNDKIREAMPFAVVGSDKEYQVNGKRVLGRKTAWGIVEVENPSHCEFAQLRDFLIRSHLQDLKEVTHNIHYETYRAKRLNENGGLHPISGNDTQESNL